MMNAKKTSTMLLGAAAEAQLALIAVHDAFVRITTTPRRGRPVTRTYGEVVSSIGWLKDMEAVVSGNALVSYLAHALLRRDLTEAEREDVRNSAEGQHQGILACGDPAQAELEIRTACRILHDDEDGSQFLAEVSRVVSMAQDVAYREARDLYVRFVPNVVTREMKKAGRHALRARYGGRFYISDSAAHSGLLLYVVQGTDLNPNSRRGIPLPQVAGLPG